MDRGSGEMRSRFGGVEHAVAIEPAGKDRCKNLGSPKYLHGAETLGVKVDMTASEIMTGMTLRGLVAIARLAVILGRPPVML